jgi:hypothetical protein
MFVLKERYFFVLRKGDVFFLFWTDRVDEI